jgi:hypothetical protein
VSVEVESKQHIVIALMLAAGFFLLGRVAGGAQPQNPTVRYVLISDGSNETLTKILDQHTGTIYSADPPGKTTWRPLISFEDK